MERKTGMVERLAEMRRTGYLRLVLEDMGVHIVISLAVSAVTATVVSLIVLRLWF